MTLAVDDLAGLVPRLRGPLLTAADPAWRERCRLASARNRRSPSALARATGVADVAAVVRHARERESPFTILAGGHEVDGWGLQDGVLGLDLTLMNGVVVDAKRRRGTVQAGARLGIMDRETAVHGLVVTGGTVSDTGVSGLTLGGGFGWLTRKYGATADNLRAIDAVTVDGDVVHASDEENPELFWAVRGGGGNFVVVTSYEFDLHPQDPVVLAGALVHSAEDAPAFLRAWRDFMLDAPDAVGSMAVLMRAAGPQYPPERQGEPLLATIVCWAGDPARGEAVLAPLRRAVAPESDRIRRQPYVELQQVFEGPMLSQDARRTHQKSGFLPEMSDAFVEEVVALLHESPRSAPGRRDVVTLCLSAMGGEFLRRDEEGMAMPRGDARFYWEAIASHTRAEDDAEWSGFVESTAAPRLRALSGPRAYLNHNNVGAHDAGFVEWAFGPAKYARLRRVKAAWDPGNVLRFNKNIPPWRP